MSAPVRRAAAGGMSRRTARAVEFGIIALCAASLAFVFQPFSGRLAGLGMILVVAGGLAFNLVPLCRPGRPLRSLLKAAAVVLAILAVAAGIAIGTAALYGDYLRASACERDKPGSRNWNVKLRCEQGRWLICARAEAGDGGPVADWCAAGAP